MIYDPDSPLIAVKTWPKIFIPGPCIWAKNKRLPKHAWLSIAEWINCDIFIQQNIMQQWEFINYYYKQCHGGTSKASVQFSHSVMSHSLQPLGRQHTRLPSPSATPGAYSKFMSIKLVMPPNRLILCRPLLPLPSIFSSIRIFSNELAPCIRWPKYWSFNLSISPSDEYSGLISFRNDWFDLPAVQGVLCTTWW